MRNQALLFFSVVRSEINASEGGKLSKCAKSEKYSVVPAKAGIVDSRLRGNDGVFFSGIEVVGR